MSARNLLLSKDAIAAIIPHAEDMCLLDGVLAWGTDSVLCVSTTHHRPDNPLRVKGRLSAINGIEYAAQAMAVHGALVNKRDVTPRAGYLASVRDVVCLCRDLDEQAGELTIDARQLFGDEDRVLYEFTLKAGNLVLLSGRAAVVLDAPGAVS
jgi:predicted hotdog family 3-hydroxylacyl-ACP dehydratase